MLRVQNRCWGALVWTRAQFTLEISCPPSGTCSSFDDASYGQVLALSKVKHVQVTGGGRLTTSRLTRTYPDVIFDSITSTVGLTAVPNNQPTNKMNYNALFGLNGHSDVLTANGSSFEVDHVPQYSREERYDRVSAAILSRHVERILEIIGENPDREGLTKTPERVAKAWQFLTQGYDLDPRTILTKAIFQEAYNEMILVKDIELFSLCEHHMLPFFGKAHVAYIPDGRIVGLSKIPRVVDVFARRLQVQERLTVQIRDTLQEVLEPKGVAVVIEATHMCMIMRGVQKQHSTTTTSAMSGVFLEREATRSEFMRLIRSV